MVSSALTLWVAVALGQAPATAPSAAAAASPEASWLKVAPAEADVILRVRSVQGARDDLGKMASAMSPSFGPQAQMFLDQGVGMFSQRFGKAAGGLPFLVMVRLPKDGDNGPPPFAVIIGAKDYAAVQKQIAGPGGDAKPKPQAGGYDSVTAADKTTFYTFKGSNFVALGTSAELVGAIAKPKTATLDRKMTPEIRERFLAGDMGVYVNLANVQARFGAQIEELRKKQDDKFDEAIAKEGPEAQGAGQAKEGLNRLIATLKDGDSLAFNVDFAPEGLTVEGVTTAKADSGSAKKLAAKKAGAGEVLAAFPDDASFYLYANVDPEQFDQIQQMATPFAAKGGKPTPEMQKALDLQREAGIRDASAAVSFTKGGVRAIMLSTYDDPKKAADSLAAVAKVNKANLPDTVKDVEFKADAQKYQNFTLSSTKVTFDQEKIAKKTPNANGVTKSLLGESMTTWSGTDGKQRLLTVTAPDWDAAKALIDTTLGGKGGIGQAAAFKAIRDKLPKQVGTLFLVSAQSLIKQGMAQYAVADPDSPAAKVKLDLPKAPALFGGAITPTAKGVLFKFLLPSDVGPVIEQGVMPLLPGDPK